jgi:hypothetical protein
MMVYHFNTTIRILPELIINSLSTGKLAFLPEPGGKTRIIAIGDYWSQHILRKPHNIIMGLLKKLETDGT